MRKGQFIFVLFTLVLGSFHPVIAQKNGIKINVFSPVARTASLFYERVLTDNKSLQLNIVYTGFRISSVKFTGLAISPEFKYYLSAPKAPKGFYLSPFLRYQNLTAIYDNPTNAEETKGSLQTFGGGIVLGKQWILGKWILLDTFLGPRLYSGGLQLEGDGAISNIEVAKLASGFGVRLGVTLGIAF